MAFLSLGGVPVRVLVNSLTEQPLVYQGGRERMMAGNIISTESNGMRVIDCKIIITSEAEILAIYAACPRGVAVAISSDITGQFLNFTALVDLQQRSFKKQAQDTYYTIVDVHLEETV